MLVDPYPIGISTAGCGPSFGCCGCDECEGSVMDVATRVDTARADAGARPVWLVVQVRRVPPPPPPSNTQASTLVRAAAYRRLAVRLALIGRGRRRQPRCG